MRLRARGAMTFPGTAHNGADSSAILEGRVSQLVLLNRTTAPAPLHASPSLRTDRGFPSCSSARYGIFSSGGGELSVTGRLAFLTSAYYYTPVMIDR